MRDNTKGGALTEVTFYILLSLYQPKHGYAVMQFIEDNLNYPQEAKDKKIEGRVILQLDGNLRVPVAFHRKAYASGVCSELVHGCPGHGLINKHSVPFQLPEKGGNGNRLRQECDNGQHFRRDFIICVSLSVEQQRNIPANQLYIRPEGSGERFISIHRHHSRK